MNKQPLVSSPLSKKEIDSLVTADETYADSLLSQNISSIYSRSKGGTSEADSLYSISSSQYSELDGSQKDGLVKNDIEGTDISWEQWLLRKTIEDIENMALRRESRKQRAVEKRKKEIEKMEILKKSIEHRGEWEKKKDEELGKKMKAKTALLREEKAKKMQEHRKTEEKVLEKFEDWQREKLAKEKEERLQLKMQRCKVNEKNMEKKLSSEESYKRWFEKAKTKKINRTTKGYSEGALFSYYDMGCSPEPSYKNPLPWVDISSSCKESPCKQLFMSPPLLWKEVEQREPLPKDKGGKRHKVVAKHSCNK